MSKKELISCLVKYKNRNVFNPYRDICTVYDKDKNSAKTRLNNLNNVLDSLENKSADSLWLGRDLGYRGGRRTGIAFTDEYHLKKASKFWKAELQNVTVKDKFLKENTATTIWDVLPYINSNVFTWNIFPFHPHLPDSPFTNRCHTRAEREDGIEILNLLLNILKPKQILAIGNDAYNCCSNINNVTINKIRHPSYGGATIFKNQIYSLLNNNSHLNIGV